MLDDLNDGAGRDSFEFELCFFAFCLLSVFRVFRGYPVVIPAGSVFVTSGTDRRSSGTHYTPRVLTEPIVQYTLEPLVYIGPAEGLPRSEWKLKSARELLELKICDMACGSGAFLVQACRYLAERLLEAWEEAERVARETWCAAGETAADRRRFVKRLNRMGLSLSCRWSA